MGPDTRRSLATSLVVLTAVLLAGATLAGYAPTGVLRLRPVRRPGRVDAAATRASATLVGDRVTDGVVLRHQEDLLSARPIIASTISEVVGAPAFRGLFRARGARRAPGRVRARPEHGHADALPTWAPSPPRRWRRCDRSSRARSRTPAGSRSLDRDIGSVPANAARIANDVRIAAYLLAALTLAAAVGALVITPDRRRTASQLGVGDRRRRLLIVVAYTIARAIALGRLHDPEDRAAAAAVWAAFLGDLRTFGWVLAGAGAVVAAAAASLVRPVDDRGPAAARLAARHHRPGHDARSACVRAAALIAAGALVIAQPLTALQVGRDARRRLPRLQGHRGAPAADLPAARPETSAASRERRAGRLRRRARRLAVPAIAVLLVAGTVVAFVGGRRRERPGGHDRRVQRPRRAVRPPARRGRPARPRTTRCRRPLPGWFAAEQDALDRRPARGRHPRPADRHPLRRPARRTAACARSSAAARTSTVVKNQDGVSDASFAAALRLRDRLGFRGEGERGMYLCHTLCELGATPLASGLRRHPRLPRHPSRPRWSWSSTRTT